MYKITGIFLLIMTCNTFCCIRHLYSIDPLIWHSSIILKGEFLKVAKPLNRQNDRRYFDAFFKTITPYKGQTDEYIKIRIPDNGKTFENFSKLKTKSHIFYLFLSLPEEEKNCNTQEGNFNCYDFIPLSSKIKTGILTLFDFGKFDQNIFNLVFDDNINDIPIQIFEEHIKAKIQMYSIIEPEFNQIILTQNHKEKHGKLRRYLKKNNDGCSVGLIIEKKKK